MSRWIPWSLVGGLVAQLAVAGDPAAAEYLRLRERSRELVRTGCGECHEGSRSTALPKALAIFDTREPDWSAHMSQAQLRNASVRLGGDLVPTQGKEEARPLKVSRVQRAEFDAYVTAEIARRQSAGK